MSKEWTTTVAAAEAAAQRKETAEEEAHERFHTVRSQLEADGRSGAVTETDEFKEWMQSRRETDEAWGQWAMAMDAKADR
jgi:exo-beta-1,3-glucanase (GH17 family)